MPYELSELKWDYEGSAGRVEPMEDIAGLVAVAYALFNATGLSASPR